MNKHSSEHQTSAMVLVLAIALGGGASWYFFGPDLQSGEQQSRPALAQEAAPVEGPQDRGMPMASPFGAGPAPTQAAAPDVTGHWIGHLDMGGNAGPTQVSFKLQATGAQLSGTATFPIGEGSIENGRITGSQVSFSTRHRLPTSSQVLITQFAGDMSDGAMALRMQTEGGESRFTIHRVPR